MHVDIVELSSEELVKTNGGSLIGLLVWIIIETLDDPEGSAAGLKRGHEIGKRTRL
jgi:hypothetical protein